MGKEKSWRDYSNYKSTDTEKDESTESEKTGSWRDYSGKTSTASGNSSGSWRDYSQTNSADVVGKNITDRVNNWLKNHNIYISNYQKRYEGRKYSYEDSYVSDSADWLDTVSKQKSNFDAEADSILSYMDQHKDYLDSDWMKSVRDTIEGARGAQSQILDGTARDNEFWSKFTPNEEQTAAGYTSDKLYEEWQAEQKQYAEDQAYDVEAGMLELEELKKEREAFLADQKEKRKQAESEESFWDSLGRWLSTTPDTTIPLAGVSGTSGGTNPADPYDKRIAELEAKIERSKYVQGYEGYMDNMDSEDYAPNSQYVSTRTDVAMDDARWGFGNTQYDTSKLFGDFLYDYINRNQDALDAAMVNDTVSDAYLLGFDKGFLKTMSDDEIGVYNYLYKTQGKDSANSYLSFIESDLEGRRRLQEQAQWASYAKEDPVGSSVFSTLISPLKGVSYVGQAADMLDDGKMDQNAGYNRFSYIPSTIRSQVSTTIENSGKWGKVGSFAYNTGMSMADFLFTTAVSGGNQTMSLAIMGTGAAADATLAAKDRGLDDADAFALGTIAGLAEIAMEKISLGAWLEGDMSEGALKYLLKNALSEGGEEAGTSVINLLADIIISGDKSEWNVAMQAYIAEGKTQEEAFGLVLAEQAAQIGLDTLGGILSGAAIGGGTYAGASTVAGYQYGNIGKNKAEAQQLVSEGLELNPDNQYVQKMQSKLDKGKNLTGMQVRNILAANQEQITANDIKNIQKAAEKRLTDLGQTQDVEKVAELATKRAIGQELTRAEKSFLAKSQYGARVANELLPENIISGDYSTEWAEGIGTKQVNKLAYNIKNILAEMAKMNNPATYKSLEERVGEEDKLAVSESGTATISKSGDTINLSKPEIVDFVRDKETGKVTDMILNVDGKQVKASEIDYADADQSYLFSAVKSIENITPGDATAIIRDYDPSSGLSVGEYLNGIDEAYTYGYHNYSEADMGAGLFTPKLSGEQAKGAYLLGQATRGRSDTSKSEAIKRMRTAVEAETEKAAAEGKEAPKGKKMTITYNEGGGKIVDFDKAGIALSEKQGAGVEVAKILHKLGLGTNFEFFASKESDTLTVKDKKTGEVKKARVFINDAGVEEAAPAGVYRKSDGTIRIDLNAYNGRELTLNALAHELTHFIQQWSDKKYKVLVDFLMKTYENTDMTMHQRVLAEQARLKDIRGEDVSYNEAYDEVVAKAMMKMFNDGKLVERLTELKAQDQDLFHKLWEGFKKILAKFLAIYDSNDVLYKDSDDLVEMKDAFEQLQNMFAEALVEASENFQAAQTIGFEMDMGTESVSPAVMHSEQTWTESDYVQQRDKAAEEIASAIGVSKKKAKAYIDSINSIAKMIAEDRSRLDYFSSPGRSSFVDNAEYGGSFDFSTLCKKRRLLTGTFTAIQKALPNTALTADEILDIRNRMKKAGLEVSCGLCYVEGSRANMGQFAKEFLRLYKQYYPDAWQPNMADVNTPDGIEWVRLNHPECYEQYEYFWNHYGTLKPGDKNLFASQQKPKLYQLHTEYKGEILNKFKNDDKVEDKNLNGGIRLQSFSDFEIVHLIDTMQIIMDMSRVGLAGQAYTKVPDFAWALGDTGLKINLSLIAKGVDANGKLVFDDVEGMPIADAMKLRDRYSKNVGTILVAFNDEQLLAAMADDRVDFIIPFHRSQWKKSQYGAMGLPAKTKDYTFMQNEKLIKPTFHEYRGRMVKDKATNYMPNEYWDFSKSGKENAEAYLEMCARNNKRPKFYKLLQNNGDGSYSLKADGSTDGYWKLLIDFKMYDNEGNGSPQMPVKPDFNMEEATRMLNDYNGGHSNFPVAQGIVDGFVKDYKASHKGQQYSSQETDLDSDGNQLSAEQVKFFKDSVVRDADGKLLVVYHGTPNGSTTIFDKAKTSEINDMGQGIYFSTNKGDASSYMGKSRGKKLYSTYVNIKAPFVVSDNVKISVSEAASLLKLCDDRSLALDVYRGDVLVNAKDGYITTSQLANTNISQQMTKILEKSGKYDGIIDETVSAKFGLEEGTKHIIALNSNQIKSIDNKNPTTNPDIRYSSQETDLDTNAVSAYDGGKKETKQEDKANGRRETREDFHRRAVQEGCTVNDRGKVAYAFRSVADWNLAESIRIAERNLREKGIPVIVCDLFEVNRDGITTPRTNAIADAGEAVYLLTSMEADPIEAAEHEAYHFWKHTQERMDYFAELYKNFDFDSPAAIDLLGRIEKAYIESKKANVETDLEVDSDESVKLIEEAFAFVTGFTASGDQRGIAHKILRDFDAVKAAWDDLVKKQSADTLYSSQETDADYLDAVNRGDMKTAQRMVDEAAKKAGYNYEGYHATFNFGFTEFAGPWNFFTNDVKIASEFVGGGEMRSVNDLKDGPGVYRTYLSLQNPLVIDANYKSWEKIEYDGEILSTDDLAQKVYENLRHKYDGIIIKNVAEGDGSRAVTDYITFSSNQSKLSDPVTYDDKGKVIPLSERFNKDKDDIRYSSQETDADYMAALDKGDIVTAQKLVDKAANDAGYTQKAYHGTGADFNIFSEEKIGGRNVWGKGFYFGTGKGIANDYATWRESKGGKYRIVSASLKMENPYINRKSSLGTAEEILDKWFPNMWKDSRDLGIGYINGKLQSSPLDLLQYIADHNKIEIRDVLRAYGYDSVRDGGELVVFSPTQIKSNEPVVWDDNGKIIPLSARFNKDNEDIRYSTQETDNISNRELLANAFEWVVKDSEEYKLIQEYKGHIKILNEYEEKLSKLNAEIRKIVFGTEGKRDSKKLKELQAEAKKVAENINRHDRKLLSLEASEPLRKVIERERKAEAKKTKDHVKELLKNKKTRAEQTELRHKIRKAVRDLDKILNRGNKKQNVKEDMKDFATKALELADYLFTDHISNDELIRRGITVRMTPKEAALVKETEDILSKLYDQADSLTDEEFTRLDAKRKANEEKLRDLLKAQRNESLNTPVYNLFDDLVGAYASLKNSSQDAVKAAYNEELENSLRAFISDDVRVKILKNMRVADMTTEELNWLYRAYTMVLTNVRSANTMFVKGKQESIEQTVSAIVMDFTKRKAPEGKVAIVARNLANKIGWDYAKLYYALDRIGSEAFTELIMNIADSENTVMQDIMEAAAYRDKIVENYGFNNWDINKEIDKEFLDNTGKKFKLTLGQLMSLYAYSRRDGAWDHIEYGGFVFGEKALTNPRPADSYKLSQAQCEAITNTLTKEQKGYVEDMQKFLSETMGAKGNEVSMMLYGIKMFGEKNYFPIHVAGQYKAQANESQAKAAAGFQSMSNAGFTHAQNPNAKAPFVLEGFNEIWADHVNEMSRYHGTVPALEDLRRVMNRSTYSDSVAESSSVKAIMENAFGKEAVDYFDNLYREANSGAIQDKLQRVPKKLLSLFRKNSVAYSLSVVIQQPSAMARAYALIDKKYFGFKGFGALTSGVAKAVSSKWNPAYANAYNEMLKYAPGVTMAKEIGGFDTHTGTSIREYLLDTGKNLKQKWKTGTAKEKGMAALDLVDNNAIANLPNVADKIAWIEIWNACKRETVATHKDLAPNSEEFMQAVGERFTEVIRATQVYDSMFSKSPLLKSKSLAVQYLVSFMNEPNTTANMVEKAVRDATKGDWKSGVRMAAAVTSSIIFNNVLKAIIYAMRDDDEDETYIEKYLAAVAGGIMGDFNPINYIPVARDAWSKAQGYDVERPDMAIISDAIDAYNAITKLSGKDTENMTEAEIAELDKNMTDASWKLVGSLAAFFGIPVKNIYREIEGVIDHARIASANAGMTTASSLWDKVTEEIIDTIPFVQTKNAKQDKLYDAIISGDQAYIARIKSTYNSESAYHSAVRMALRENDPRIKDAAQARYDGNTEEYKRIFREIQKEGKFTFDDIMSAINTELSKLTPDKVTSDYTASGYVEAIAMGNMSNAEAMKEDIIATKVANGKTQAEAEKEFASSVATGIRNAYTSGLLDEAGAKKMLMEYADKDEEEAASKISYWTFCEEHPEYDLSESNVNDYLEFAEPADISVDVYAQFINGTKGLSDIKDQWGDVEVTKREQVLEVIASLPLTWQQKDALYLAAGYSESKIWDVPW